MNQQTLDLVFRFMKRWLATLLGQSEVETPSISTRLVFPHGRVMGINRHSRNLGTFPRFFDVNRSETKAAKSPDLAGALLCFVQPCS
ncbi:hypothetical protein [Synechococcus sp. A15-60]|uniref:hypothetical protein n=1 Tax=Synechococcus sp. A15-60 TaxID=1050655 RepID=UPI0016453929|nr:hypothetical protein [Synechococcus sp. A15-60]